MTPQFGFSEILVLALLAIIVVGPKDLPILMKNIGKFFSSLQSLGNEFKSAFAEMDATNEISEIQKEISLEMEDAIKQHLSKRIEAMEKDQKRIREMFPDMSIESWNGHTN